MSSATIDLTPERWVRVNDVFAGALNREPDQRSAFVAEQIDDDPELVEYILTLLNHNPSVEATVEGAICDAISGAFQSLDGDSHDISGSRIGQYRVERILGQGGMGTVYLAKRDDKLFEQQVAIKLGRRTLIDPLTQARLSSERQILANLNHPNIASLLDGGTTNDGAPYLVMEYVDGVRIDTYCDVHRLTVDSRLKLFRCICEAVHYAHRNLVVHRDIKAANILVTADGTLKLLDFGIAKLVDEEGAGSRGLTREGVSVMTLENAAPEQLLQEPISTATDTYALGLLLYRLLTGSSAFNLEGLNPAQFANVVCHSEPVRPSVNVSGAYREERKSEKGSVEASVVDIARNRGATPAGLTKLLRGDIDTIVMNALRKEPERRYPSSLQLSIDISAHQNSIPISAQADSWRYRTSKFIRRHAIGVTMSSAALIVLVLFSTTLYFQNEKIAAERDHALEVSRFLVDIFTAPDPANARGLDITAKEILAAGAQRISHELGDRPEIQSSLMETIGRVYLNLGEYEPSIDMLEQSLELRERTLGRNHPDIARGKNELAEVLIRKAEYARARELLQESLLTNRGQQGHSSKEVAENLFNLAELHLAMGELDSAQAFANESIEIYAPRREEFGIELAEAKNTLARILQVRGDLDQTEALLRESIEIVKSTVGSDHPLMAYYLQNLGVLLKSKGDLNAAEKALSDAIVATKRILGDKHDLVATTLSIQGGLLHARGDYTAAERAYREALAIDIEARGPRHPFVGYDMTGLGILLHDKGDLVDAESTLRDALGIYGEALDENHQYIASALTELGAVLTSQRRADEAISLFERALRIRRIDYTDDNVLVAATLSEYGNALLSLDRVEEARDSIEHAARVFEEKDDRRAWRARTHLSRLNN